MEKRLACSYIIVFCFFLRVANKLGVSADSVMFVSAESVCLFLACCKQNCELYCVKCIVNMLTWLTF